MFQSAVIAAVINIRIPLLLGDLVNVVSQLETGHELQYYLSDLRGPAVKLACHYVAQVPCYVITHVYVLIEYVVNQLYS